MGNEDAFWRWFVEHQTELYDFEHEPEQLLDDLADALQMVNGDLTFEFGPTSEEREFILSAGGLKRSFAAVTSLIKAAPKLDRWKLIAFRPRRPLPVIVELGGVSVNSEDIEVSLLDDGKTAGLHLFIPHFREEDANLKQIGYLLLDETLGEYDVETKLGLIKMLPSEGPSRFKKFSLSELPPRFDQLNRQLEGNPPSAVN